LELTPVEEYNGVLYKRDDLYAPYGSDFVTGGKIRQCRDLIETNLDYIKSKCDSTISTAASIHSPQAVIVSRVAQEYGLDSIIGFGNTSIEGALKHKAMSWCKDMGSELVVLSESQGFNNVLYSNLNKLSETRPMFKVLFGYAAQQYRSSIIGKISEQVQNIPDDVDILFVPCGSAVTFTGVIEGKRIYNKNFQLVGLQPFGYDRKSDINKNLEGMVWDYDYNFHIGNWPYHQLYEKNVGFELDRIYESKAYDMMINSSKYQSSVNPCFWVIGNSNNIR
tara:strand:- start:5 stop:841 length:837 start_codon:yes stop_codon:yes gene_type:complete